MHEIEGSNEETSSSEAINDAQCQPQYEDHITFYSKERSFVRFEKSLE